MLCPLKGKTNSPRLTGTLEPLCVHNLLLTIFQESPPIKRGVNEDYSYNKWQSKNTNNLAVNVTNHWLHFYIIRTTFLSSCLL